MPDHSPKPLTPGQLLRVHRDDCGAPRPVTPKVAIYLGLEKDYLPESDSNERVALTAWPHAPGTEVGPTPMWSVVPLSKLAFDPMKAVANRVTLDDLEGFSVPTEWLEGRTVSPVVLRWDDGSLRAFPSPEHAAAALHERSVRRMISISS